MDDRRPTPAGTAHLRIGDAERDSVAEALHEHFAKGRLTREELDERLDVALRAKTESNLRELMSDLPQPRGLPEPKPADPPRPATPSWTAGPPWAAGPPPWAAGRPGPPHWRGRRHGPPPLVPILFLFFLLATLGGGVSAAFVAVKLLFLLWLGVTLFAITRFRRNHRHHHRHHRRW